MFWFSSRSVGEALSEVESRVFTWALEVVWSVSYCILTFLYRLWVLVFRCYVLILSWALMRAYLLSLGPSCLLLLLYGLFVWLGRLLSLLVARVVYRHWCVSMYFIDWWGSIWLYSWMWCPGLNPSVKLHALHFRNIGAKLEHFQKLQEYLEFHQR
jgi:hypothetical protein